MRLSGGTANGSHLVMHYEVTAPGTEVECLDFVEDLIAPPVPAARPTTLVLLGLVLVALAGGALALTRSTARPT